MSTQRPPNVRTNYLSDSLFMLSSLTFDVVMVVILGVLLGLTGSPEDNNGGHNSGRARTGEWAVDIARKYPSSRVTAIETIVTPSPRCPLNLTFYQDDIQLEWIHPKNSFDLVRFSLQSERLHDYSTLLGKTFRSLAPGGFVEIYDVEPAVHFADGQTCAQSSTFLWQNLYEQAHVNGGSPLATMEQLKDQLSRVGFVNIATEVFEVPCSPWSSESKARRVGQVRFQAN
ncbi:hypothetical protein AYO20_09676 [Fonsecaea nubica]|uniref:Methyltransferase type 11 domain-containing protein n=1 Tax=Fonsecaea nubica TaxID=856822 RepID=A0A178CFK7_9EURO|nr:hypothetical protein AYO20_09676 [Fonsecaea nubica]OAL27823.1 hypothetical protein AYO20_09676 [Fonsecaea nubica]